MGIGIDEAGRGPVLGPLVICSLYILDPGELIKAGAKDSKVLDHRRRKEVKRILSGRVSSSIMVVPAEAIDEARVTMTMNDLEVRGFASVLCSLLSGRPMSHPRLPGSCKVTVTGQSPLCHVTMDAADVDESRFTSRVRAEAMSMMDVTGITIEGRHKADSTCPEVSAASIFAKIERDRLVEEIGEEFGIDVGSGYPHDPVTVSFIQEYVSKYGSLPRYTRKSWDTARMILARSRTLTLDVFTSDQPVQ